MPDTPVDEILEKSIEHLHVLSEMVSEAIECEDWTIEETKQLLSIAAASLVGTTEGAFKSLVDISEEELDDEEYNMWWNNV